MSKRIIIFDTTLRDGEQSPGMSMTKDEKLMVAEGLDQMGVDVIEAGFAIASEGDFEAVNAIAKATKNSVICSLARAKHIDIDRAAEAIKPAKRGRIHTFISTSDIHLEHQFRLTRDQVIDIIRDTVGRARNYTDDVEWSAMDATRSDMDYLCKAVETAIAAGATTINLPDTVGYGLPENIAHMFKYVRENVPNSDKAIFSFHGQNDLGLASANSLAAVQAGAGQIECTINGIGERAGNTSLEEVVMALKVRAKEFNNAEINIDTTHIMKLSRMIQQITGQPVQVNKAIVGANAFAHESGIHQDGMLKNRDTYEIMTPESVGLTKSNLVMGKHSGRHAFKEKLAELGFDLGDNALEDAFNRFKTLADKKKEIFDEDLISLIEPEPENQNYEFGSLRVNCGTGGDQTAHIKMEVDGNMKEATETGNGPVDATFRAIRALVNSTDTSELALYQVQAVTGGTDAQVEAVVRLEQDEKLVTGRDANVDLLVASAKAYINALNRLASFTRRIQLTDVDDGSASKKQGAA